MAAIFEAPAAHEGVHESVHEWEWEHPETHEWEGEWEHPETHEMHAETHEMEDEWEHPEAHEWEHQESHEWEHPETHEWEGEWEHPETHAMEGEWEHPETHEWEHPESHEWEGEWEHPESHEWEHPESHEWEGDPFFGKMFKRITSGLGSLAKRIAPGAIRALAGMIPGVGAIAGPLLGQLTQSILREGEYMAAQAEAESFGGSHGEAEVGHSETAHEAALSELLAAEAAMASSEAEAASTISATLPLTITIMRAGRTTRPVMPVLTQANARLAQTMVRSGPRGRQLLRTVPSIQRLAVGTIKSAARAGKPVTPPLAVGAMAAATRRVLGNPRRVDILVNRNLALRQRTAPPRPRRAMVYQPQRRTPYHPRRSGWDRAPF